MSWFRLPNAFSRDPKILEAGANATLLHIAAIAWSDEHLTDGQIPASAVPALWPWTNPSTGRQTANATSLAARLVSVGLWSQADRAYQIIGYHETQRTAEDITNARKQAADRMARLRRSRELLENADETSGEPGAKFGRSSEVEERRGEKSRKFEEQNTREREDAPANVPIQPALLGTSPSKSTKARRAKKATSGTRATTEAEQEARYTPRFNAFWALYPAKVDKAEAAEVWHRYRLDEVPEADAEALLAGVGRFAGSDRVRGGYIMSPRRFLLNRQWLASWTPASRPTGATVQVATDETRAFYKSLGRRASTEGATPVATH
jgi:hypothetical protein